MIPELWRIALETWGADGFHEAQRRFHQGFDVPTDPGSGREFESLFLTWFALRFAPKPKRGHRSLSAAQQWLDDPSHATDPDRRFVGELVTRPVSFHHIVAVAPGQSIDLSHGGLDSFTVSWTKPGNKVNPSWDNTILGTVSAMDGALTATVNSRRRATRLRREIEKRLGGRVMFVRSVEESLEAMLADARSREPRDPDPEPPELAAVTAAMIDRHWTEWLDTPVPALENQTPRQAAKTPNGRERLAALLDEFEWHADAPQAPPVARLRAELGLEAR